MAYSPYSAVNAIYNLKNKWHLANKQGDITARDDAAEKAKAYYQQLRDNGYSDVADELTASDYKKASPINEKWAKMGRTATRPYLYSLGKSYGMSSQEIDNLIGWDNQTGEITFGGKNIGKPDAGANGVSYWDDTTALDNAFNDYITRSGTTRSKSVAVDQENENLFSKYNQAYEDLTKTNPFTTDEAKAILGKYSLAGLQARDNAAASGGASNGGNIDSYSAANAMRQQASLLSQGQDKVLSAHQQKIDNVRSLLTDMGVNIDRVFNQDETAKMNDYTIKRGISEVTGETPIEWVISNNPYLNSDGTIKDQYKDVDFSQVMAKAKESGDTAGYEAAATARYYKIMGNYGLYGQYDDGNYKTPGAVKTEAAKQSEFERNQTATNNQVDNWVKESSITGKTPLELSNKNNPYLNADGTIKDQYKDVDFSQVMAKAKESGDTAGYEAAATARYYKIMGNYGLYGQYDDGNYKAPVQEQSEAGREFDKGIEADIQLAGMSKSGSSGGGYKVYSSGGSSKTSTKPKLTAAQATSAIEKGEITQGVIDAYNYYFDADYTVDNPPDLTKGKTTKTEKPTLTASQAVSAIENGNITQKVIDAFIYYYGGDYTVDNPPDLAKETKEKSLTGSQATTAMKNGELNETILKAYNDAYETSYTLSSPPPVYNPNKSNTLADQWMKKLNDEISSKYPGYTAINKSGTTFKRGNVDADYIILRVLQSNELTDDEKESVLDSFGITESEIKAVYNDKHYR